MNDPNDNYQEKPPDDIYKIIKCPLKAVLKNYNTIQPILDKGVNDINKFVIYGYQFIRLYLLEIYNNNLEFPKIDKQFVLDILKVIGSTQTTRGKQKIQKNVDEKDDIKRFYNATFKKLINEKLSYTNKTFILEQTEMITCG